MYTQNTVCFFRKSLRAHAFALTILCYALRLLFNSFQLNPFVPKFQVKGTSFYYAVF